MGNLRSVQKGFERAGFKAAVVSSPAEIEGCAGIVLPGVGAFAGAMSSLQKTGMDRALTEAVRKGIPLLGICLGHQLLFDESEEWGITRGLGLIPGRVRRLPEGLKVPHMGWNQIEIVRPSPIMEGIPDKAAFYFVHSYYAEPVDPSHVVAVTEYGISFAAAVARENVFGVQFHPEKSSILGLRILENFGGLVSRC